MTFQTGAMYLTTAIWDLRPPQTPTDTLVYNIIGYMSPVTYLIKSLIDFNLANRINLADRLRWHKKREERALQRQESTKSTPENGAALRNKHRNAIKKSKRKVRFLNGHPNTTPENGVALLNEHPNAIKKNILKKVPLINEHPNTTQSNTFKKERKFSAHRRDIVAAMIFFVAASFSVISILAAWLSAGDEKSLTTLDGISVHAYMISAIIAIVGSCNRRCCLSLAKLSDADTLETLGDILFLIGSIVNVVLFDMGSVVNVVLFDYDFDGESLFWPIISSIFWCIDALLYLISDCVTASQNSARASTAQPGRCDSVV